MALPAQQQNGFAAPGSPAESKRDFLPRSAGADTARRRADDSRRLRRVKDSKEQLKRRTTRARGASYSTIDTTASNTSAGRSYTVANVNNGVIYLRPVVRPGNLRGLPQPDPFVLPPQTPPDSATLDSVRPVSDEWEQSLYGSRTPRSEPTPPLPDVNEQSDALRLHAHAHPYPHPHPHSHSHPHPHPHGRSRSFSTAEDHHHPSSPTEPGTFKVVIERPSHGRPKRQIPHRSRYCSAAPDSRSCRRAPSQRPIRQVNHRVRDTMDRPTIALSGHSSARVSQAPIGPRLYDALTANPDDRAVVRFNVHGDMIAATPARLVAHITSPSFLDYELLSDFFLTFRAFLCTRDLIAYLISRLRWAVERQDDFGRIVRVRTFVALRHWILNYFVDDFMPCYALRCNFCHLVNSLYTDLQAREDGGGGDLKIVGELKKCWRRTCALYWDTEDSFAQNCTDTELLPGGEETQPGPVEEPVPILLRPTTPPRSTVRDTKETMGSNPSDHFASRHMDWAQRARHTPQNSMSSPYVPSQEYENETGHQVPLSPASTQSMHVLSCSIPMRSTNKQDNAVELPLYPHPVPVPVANPAPANTVRLTSSPQQPSSPKRNHRPTHSHSYTRSGSFSDALRDSRAPLSIHKSTLADYAMSAVANMPGTLVRGGLIHLGSPYFEVKTLRPRPHSTGSVSNRTHSVSNSVILRSDRYIDPDTEALRGVEGPPEAEIPKKPISLVATHSSQPNLRPSFEAEVAKLAALPDDTDDEGGVESALMKLEGRYEKKSPNTDSRRTTVDMDEPLPTTIIEQIFRPGTAEQDEHYDNDEGFHHQLASSETDGDGMYRLPDENGNRRVPAVTSVGESTDSYSSIPLLDRGLSDLVTPQRARTLETMRSSAKPSPLQFASQFPSISPQSDMPPGTSSSMNSSIEYVVETESMKRIPTGGTLPMTSYARESFLVDEDEDVSDAASTPGARSGYSSHGVRSFFDDEVATPGVDADNHPTHPMRHPPTPPLTANRLNDTMPDATDFDRGPPTPGLTPTVSRGQTQTPNHATGIPFDPPKTRPTPQLPTKHLPFVLAYDSETLAQQFTIVEKDALDEIDWKELIELRWKQSSPQIRDWVQYLRTEEARGVDVVIARFNLVVKWVVSECLLTEDIHERARCIVKYIHIATHARRYRNYATMYQIAIALISNDISSLKKTWALVPAAEILVMQELEGLVQPLKNFHNLRLEMETATVEDGCIPFIGVYTRDLIYNAQKPAFIDAPVVDGERLVNFDRHHTAASIVKNLLRLLEASSKYTFKVEPHIISKCLWLAALSDEEITQRSRQCE
ncbi:low temperature essential 1 [Pyrenophora tritici-repentis Pt-1C-BFP]|uniref:Low temperature essential 1 n=1 Tax=Pyrenophora tritici-repentis (strain Pt-1C-BFP) TaxID=426418 RepID=B2WNU6_PYRTR|nr:low temperature essential 1 [Pyrenophora tritici-repentis Pt-1C-BFP]EDU44706.1 low temperature essential 1 [Pyrenophora tritici-repentis Pt-1C-BFP]